MLNYNILLYIIFNIFLYQNIISCLSILNILKTVFILSFSFYFYETYCEQKYFYYLLFYIKNLSIHFIFIFILNTNCFKIYFFTHYYVNNNILFS